MIKLTRFLRAFRLPIGVTVTLVALQTLAQLYLPRLMADLVDVGIARGDTGFILRAGGWMLLVSAGGIVCAVVAAAFSSRVAMGFGRTLRSEVFAHVQRFSLQEFDKIDTPSLITRSTNDVTQVQMFAMIVLQMMITAPLTAVGGVMLALSEDRQLAWVIVAVIPILVVVIVLVASRAMPLFTSMQAKLDRINQVMREGLTGIRVIRAFDRERAQEQRFHIANADLTQTAVRVNKLVALLMPVMLLTMNLTTVAIIWFGAVRIDTGEMQVGNMMAFIQYAIQILFSMMMMSFLFVMLPRAAASAKRINEVFALIPGIHDPTQPQIPGGQTGHLEFRNVTFRYPGAEHPAISDLSFSAGPGEVTAIIGGTGSGKTSAVNLIPRFYDVESGVVLVDGVDVGQMTQEDLRARIGFVPQQANLFSGTIAENIRFGKPEASTEEVAQAARLAQAEEFILEMKDGFDAVLAQGGANLSGGQKQRLAIARAVVRRPEIYVFDDTFSALDYRTDARLRAALAEEIGQATVVIVAQRVSTIIQADRIVVLEAGAVAGVGTHAELTEGCEVYREIVESQLAVGERA